MSLEVSAAAGDAGFLLHRRILSVQGLSSGHFSSDLLERLSSFTANNK